MDLDFVIPFRSDGFINSKAITEEIFNNIKELTPFVKDTTIKSLSERVYCIVNNISDSPKCLWCGNPTNFLKRNLGFAKFCSKSCAAKKEVHKNEKDESYLKLSKKEKYNFTCQERYGVQSHNSSKIVKQNKIKSCQKKYGVDNGAKTKEAKDKISIALANNFQARRNNEGTDYAGSVYILHFPKYKAVKIGLSGDFKKRSKSLICNFGEFSVIGIIETQECYALESSLHEKFSEYRICLDKGTGRTEFFKDDILYFINS
jgi:hypothetical protein